LTEELFDIYDDELRPIGVAPRGEVHAKGLWHRSFHCWLAAPRRDGGLTVRFQKRAPGKDTFPDHYDVTAAGHLSAGETHRDAAREIREELGLAIPFDELTFLFECRSVREGAAGGVPFIDREISRVYGALSGVTLDEFRLQTEETSGIFEADARDLIALFEGRIPEVEASGRVARRRRIGAPSGRRTRDGGPLCPPRGFLLSRCLPPAVGVGAGGQDLTGSR